MAQSAVSAIRTGCQFLAEGKAEIDKFKKNVEGGVKDAKEIYKQVTGIWGWLKGLFSPRVGGVDGGVQQTPAIQPAAPKPRAAKQKDLTYEEYQARSVHEICEHLKVYFEAIRALKAHCRELEQQSLTTEKVADSAIDRIELEWQMNQLAVQVREAMVYTPEALGLQALYRRFLEMYDQILEEQEFARDVKAKKDRDGKWQRELLKHHRIDKAVTVVAVLILVAWMWGLLLSLGWLVRTPGGLQSLWSS
jgi:hypothetical protein